MIYEGAVKRSEAEISAILSNPKTLPRDRIGAVLSAIYYGTTIEFSGNTLITEFAEAEYEEKIYLKNLFETFHGMCRTIYRIDDGIRLLEEYKKSKPKNAAEIDSSIDALREYKDIFKNP